MISKEKKAAIMKEYARTEGGSMPGLERRFLSLIPDSPRENAMISLNVQGEGESR